MLFKNTTKHTYRCAEKENNFYQKKAVKKKTCISDAIAHLCLSLGAENGKAR